MLTLSGLRLRGEMQAKWIVCKPPVVGVVIWFVLTFAFCGAAGVVLPLVGAPTWVTVVFGTLALIAIGNGIAIARSRVRYNEHKIESRYFRHIRRKWDDASGWSRTGENGTVFIGFSDGAIIGSDGWALNDNDVDDLIPILEQRLGDPKTGNEMIMPWYVKLLIGNIVR